MALYYYFEPQVKNVAVIRCNSSGTADDGGTYLKISATRNYCKTYQTSQVATEIVKNYCLIRYRYRVLPSGSYSSWVTILARTASSDSVTTGALVGSLSAEESYEVIVGVLDDAGKEANTSIILSSKGVFMHRDGEQNSLSIGEVVTEKNTVTIAEKLTTFIKGLLKTKNIESSGTVSASGGFATGSAKFSSTSVDMHEEGYFGNFYMSLPQNAEYPATAYLSHPYGGQLIANCGAGRAALTGLTAPVDASDATNKEYVDTNFAPAGCGYGDAMAFYNIQDGTFEATLDQVLAEMPNYSARQIQFIDAAGLSTQIYEGTLWKYTASYAALNASNYNGTQATKTKYGGTWRAWEFLNPGMVAGVENATLERYNNKTVYTVVIDCKTLPSQGSKSVTTTIPSSANVLSAVGIVVKSDGESESMPCVSSTGAIRCAFFVTRSKNIVINTFTDMSSYNGYVTVKYTKN